MSNRFVVEANRRVVGVAVRVAGGYKFFSSNPAYQGLDSQVFPHARTVTHMAQEVARQLELTPGKPFEPREHIQ